MAQFIGHPQRTLAAGDTDGSTERVACFSATGEIVRGIWEFLPGMRRAPPGISGMAGGVFGDRWAKRRVGEEMWGMTVGIWREAGDT